MCISICSGSNCSPSRTPAHHDVYPAQPGSSNLLRLTRGAGGTTHCSTQNANRLQAGAATLNLPVTPPPRTRRRHGQDPIGYRRYTRWPPPSHSPDRPVRGAAGTHDETGPERRPDAALRTRRPTRDLPPGEPVVQTSRLRAAEQGKDRGQGAARVGGHGSARQTRNRPRERSDHARAIRSHSSAE